MRAAVLSCALLLGLGTPVGASTPAWPDTTRSLVTKAAVDVFHKAGGRSGDKLGRIAKGQRLAWKQVVKGKGKCKRWVEVEPYGWVCGKDLKASDEEPLAIEVPRTLRPGSEFAGVEVASAASWPLVWAVQPQVGYKNGVGKPGKPVAVRAAANKSADQVRTLEPRTIVELHETDGDWARIGDGEWVPLTHLRIAQTTARPDGVGADERWIDVDLDQQTLVAYEGDAPVYATLVSSGRSNYTKTGIYRVHKKIASMRMRDRNGRWDRPDTPFVLYYKKHLAIHGAYWHDGFGNAWSVGCVNLTAADARWVYEFVPPVVPVGWLELRLPEGQGTVIRIRSAKDPEPKWLDWNGKPIKRARAK